MNGDTDVTKDKISPTWRRKPVIILVVAAASLVLGVAITLVLHRNPLASDEIRNVLQAQASSITTTPLYYPKSPSEDFSILEGSVGLFESQVVHFTLTNGANQIIITEQPRPSSTEELTKTKEFTTPIGEAYLANLGGRIAGFIFTEKTLIILNSSGNASPPDQLERIMRSMAAL
jgi:hypothetical protein